MPCDRFAFAVFVGGEEELVGFFHERFEFGDFAFFIWVDDVERCEIVIDIDALFGPSLFLNFCGDVGGALWQVADVADGCFDDVFIPEVIGDLARFGGGFDYY